MRAEDLHGCLGENVKVHFAGAENVDFSWVLHDAGVKYFLFTVLPFIMDQFDIRWGRITNAKHLFPHEVLLEIVIGICDTPFIYAARKIKSRAEG